jgi:hypothetical protein
MSSLSYSDSPSDSLTLAAAESLLASASAALGGWLGRQTTATHTYVADGHEAIRLIDQLSRELYRVCGLLVQAIRTDEDERAVRVDVLIAQLRRERAERDRLAGPSAGMSGPSGTVRDECGPSAAVGRPPVGEGRR